MSEEKKYKDIELRSEKVRNIVGKTPPIFLRIGISVITLIIISTILIAYFTPFPQYKIISVQFYSNPLIQTDKAVESGIFFSTLDTTFIFADKEIGWMQEQNDSIKYYKSKIAGSIILNLDNGDFVEKNDILYTIIPDSIEDLYAISHISIEDINQVKIGQSVSIFLEQGLLIGVISNIFPIPDNGKMTNRKVYKLKICFPINISNINNEILFSNKEYKGKILISSTPILQKILNY